MLVIFLIFFFHNVVQVEPICRLSQLGLAAAEVNVVSPLLAPSLAPPVNSVTETVGLLFSSSRILAESPFMVFSDEFGSSSGSTNVPVIVICTILLAGLFLGLFWYICAKLKQEDDDEVVNGQGSRGYVDSVFPVPPVENRRGGVESKPTHPPHQPIANGRGGGGSKPSHAPAPPEANAQGVGGESKPSPPIPPVVNDRGGGRPVPTHAPGPSIANALGGVGSKPTNVPVPPVANGNGGDRSVATQPSAPQIAPRKSRHPSVEPRVKTDVRNAPIELETLHPMRVKEPGKSSELPSRLAEVGLIPFSYEELRYSTDNFSRANFLGEGGFAKVYKGSLANDRKIAVKVLRNENSKAEKEFRNEVDIISRAKHRNIVSLVGYCITQIKRLIVYEFVENRSLHDHLCGGKDIQVMDWAIRMKIARGASKGLAYLHEECPQKIIHRDVKPANILLDFSFVPKVADFGIAKLCPDHFDSLIATHAIGSIGFIDPAYVETKELSFKSDVYAFGVVLLMLISGQINLGIVHGLKSELSRALRSGNFQGIADERLNKNYDVNEITRMVTCADACLRREPKDRPYMSQISRVLENIVLATDLRIKTRPRRSV